MPLLTTMAKKLQVAPVPEMLPFPCPANVVITPAPDVGEVTELKLKVPFTIKFPLAPVLAKPPIIKL